MGLLTKSFEACDEAAEQLDAWLEKARKPKLGTGKRFAALERKISKRGNVDDPAAVAAAIGRKKYGKRKFQRLAQHGK